MIQLVTGNLNSLGNAGNFETDRSTWGFANPSGTEITRQIGESTKGVSSAKVRAVSGPSQLDTVSAEFPIAVGKKYLVRAKIKTTPWTVILGTPYYFGDDEVEFSIVGSLFTTKTSEITKTVDDAKDTWVTIEATFDNISSPFSTETVKIQVNDNGGSILNPNGFFFVDEFEVYEYIEVPDVVECDLAIDSVGIVNESAPSAGDGQLTVNASGGDGTLEYSKDNGGTWQLSNVFTGLASGVYFVKVREQANTDCEDSAVVLVNAGAEDFDFTAAVTHESVAGATDGQISITATGSGTPWTYSKDAGVTYQASNVFNNLAPGLYYVVVKSSSGILVLKQVTVNAGAQQFDKIYFSKNPITLEKLAVTNWDALVNYRLYADVRVEDVADSNAYVSKLKQELTPSSQDNALFYLGAAFRGVFGFTPPALNASEIIRNTERIKRFVTYTGELQATDVLPGALTASLPNIVLFGGIDKIHYPDLNFFGTYLPANKKFMTWAPLIKTVDKLQEDYLSYFVFGNTSTIKLQIKAYFDDGTNETAVTKTKAGTERAQLYQIPAGPSNSGALLVNAEKNLVKYELSLLDQSDSLISEVRTYLVAPVRHPRTRYFLFLNSLSGYEVLRFTGIASKRTEYTKEVIQKFLSANYQSADGEFEVNMSIMSERGSYSSGHVNKQWHEYLKDFLLSSRVFDITTGKRIPVSIFSADHNDEDQVYNRYIRFEARPAYDNTSFTPELI